MSLFKYKIIKSDQEGKILHGHWKQDRQKYPQNEMQFEAKTYTTRIHSLLYVIQIYKQITFDLKILNVS